jgi:hypothetical protein
MLFTFADERLATKQELAWGWFPRGACAERKPGGDSG